MFSGAQGIIQVVYGLGLCEDKYSNSTGMIEREWIQWVYDVAWVLERVLSRYVQPCFSAANIYDCPFVIQCFFFTHNHDA